MPDSVRAYVIGELVLPDGWKVVDEQRVPDIIASETVVVKHSSFTKLRNAPIGALEHDVILAVFVPNRDLAKAEDRLDKAIVTLMESLDDHPNIGWEEARKVITPNSQFPGWEIDLKVITTKTPATESE